MDEIVSAAEYLFFSQKNNPPENNLISLAFGNPASPTRGSLNGGTTFNLYFLPNRSLQKLFGFEFLLLGNSLY